MTEIAEIPADVRRLAMAVQSAAIRKCQEQNLAVHEYPFASGRASSSA